MRLIEPSYGLYQGCATFTREGPLKTFPAAQGPQLNRYKTCVESIKINIRVIVTSSFYWILDISFSPPQSLALLGLGLLEVNFSLPLGLSLFSWHWFYIEYEKNCQKKTQWTEQVNSRAWNISTDIVFARKLMAKINTNSIQWVWVVYLSNAVLHFLQTAQRTWGPQKLFGGPHVARGHRVAHPCSKSIGNLRFRQRPNTIAYITVRLSFSTVLWQLRPRYKSGSL